MSHFSRRSAARQQPELARHVKKIDANHFFNLLTSPRLLDRVEAHLPEHPCRARRSRPACQASATENCGTKSACQSTLLLATPVKAKPGEDADTQAKSGVEENIFLTADTQLANWTHLGGFCAGTVASGPSINLTTVSLDATGGVTERAWSSAGSTASILSVAVVAASDG